jgi:hypothetical protein
LNSLLYSVENCQVLVSESVWLLTRIALCWNIYCATIQMPGRFVTVMRRVRELFWDHFADVDHQQTTKESHQQNSNE